MKKITILAVETSCDDTSAAVLQDNVVLSNIIANQEVHRDFGGVVPELASRAHQQHIVPVIEKALQSANISKKNLDVIVFTRGPGLMGSLLVGVSFAKAMAMSLGIPVIDADHLQAHIYALFLDKPDKITQKPKFPFICLLISGGHTKLAIVNDFLDIDFVGDTIDDAAGEAFDKSAKIMGLPYPGGPVIDKLAANGNIHAFKYSKPSIPGFNFSFSGLKTSILYSIRDHLKDNPQFIEENLSDLCASIQHTISEILIEKTFALMKKTGIHQIGVAGGVSANSYLRKQFAAQAKIHNADVFFPDPAFTTDNAAMIGMLGLLKYKAGLFSTYEVAPFANNDTPRL